MHNYFVREKNIWSIEKRHLIIFHKQFAKKKETVSRHRPKQNGPLGLV